MPFFEVIGRGKDSGRQRRREIRALDQATVLATMEAEGTLVDQCIELPYPAASPQLIEVTDRLGLALGEEASKPECVFEILNWCHQHHRVALIEYLTDIEGRPWRTFVEPYGFRRSKEGFRLRCFRPLEENEPEVVSDFQTEGWHLYLVEDIEWAAPAAGSFRPRPYRREPDEVSISISFRSV
jgi:hypothetical protein